MVVSGAMETACLRDKLGMTSTLSHTRRTHPSTIMTSPSYSWLYDAYPFENGRILVVHVRVLCSDTTQFIQVIMNAYNTIYLVTFPAPSFLLLRLRHSRHTR